MLQNSRCRSSLQPGIRCNPDSHMPADKPRGAALRGHLSPFTRHFFLNKNHTPRDTNPRTRAAAAQARGPTGPHFVVANVKPGSTIRNRKADKMKNITALMMNEPGSIRLPPGINSRIPAFRLPPDAVQLLSTAQQLNFLGRWRSLTSSTSSKSLIH